MKLPWYTGKLIEIQKVNTLTWRFWIEIPELEKVEFRPGQFVTLDLPIHEKRIKRWRSYSIANAPNDTNIIELVIVYLEGGAASNYLFNDIKIGDDILLRGPLGVFVMQEEMNNDICMIATGTGVGPFRAMLWYIHENNIPHKNIFLLFGTRQKNNLLYKDEFEELETLIPNFKYIPVLSRSDDWEGRKGHVHTVYEELFADGRDADFYLCGWKVMVDEARNRIEALGYNRKEDIHLEIYG